jgi:hypothetical protein
VSGFTSLAKAGYYPMIVAQRLQLCLHVLPAGGSLPL